MLAACGGGGGGAGSPASGPPTQQQPSSPTQVDETNAGQSQLSVVFKADSGELLINWVDTFPDETGYRVERQLTAGGSWELQESLPATAGTAAAYSWSRVIDRSASYRIVASKQGYVVPLETPAGVTTIPLDLQASMPELIIDPAGTLSGTVNLSVQGADSASEVRYFIDLQAIGVSSAGPSFVVPWATTAVPDGNHLVLAHVQQAPGLTIELRQPVVTDNPNVAVFLVVSGSDDMMLTAHVSSDTSITSVEFFKENESIGLGTAPTWALLYDARALPPGPVTFRVVVTDANGEQAEASKEVIIDHQPQLSLSSPVDGQIATGSLDLQGVVTDDLPNVVTTVHLGDVQILQTTQSSFSHSYSLAGLPGGQYTLRVRVADSSGQSRIVQRAVIVAPTPVFSYQRINTLEPGAAILETAAGRLLYQLPNGTKRLRLANSSEVDLQGSAQIAGLSFVNPDAGQSWQLSADGVATFGSLPSGSPKVFLFDDLGARVEVPYDSSTDAHDTFLRSGLHGSWLVWGNGRIYIRNLIVPGADIGPVTGNLFRGHAFLNTPGSEALFFTRDTGSVGASTIIDLFRYNVDDQSISQITGGDAQATLPKVDQARLAWSKKLHAGGAPHLVVAPVGNPTATTTLTTQLQSFDLDDGVLAWLDLENELRVDDGSSTTTISHTPSTTLYSARNGNVIFGENGKLYVWTAAQGKRLLLDALPTLVRQRDDVVFFTTGLQNVTIYRVDL